ncbi:MAG: ABC-F family ATP-binding cassette domain-containing protein [Firmicutes bacterium]|nr:ABC-F family ATP-binding cassette domain-containing protein [Bacillota bacterium]
MSILTVENVSHSYGGRIILQNASFRLLKGEHVGLVGANGEGKTTFLNIITGNLMPDSGKISWCNRVTTGYLDQYTALGEGKTIRSYLREAFAHLDKLDAELQEVYEKMSTCGEDELQRLMDDMSEITEILEGGGYYMIDARIQETAQGLGLCEIGLDRDVTELSGGQRAKVLLAKVLLENPMILILDEPTNFLDESHIAWLKNFLRNYDNAFIMVSHDIPFLNDTVNIIYHVDNGVLTRYVGNYDKFEEAHALRQKQQDLAYERQQKEIETMETFIAKNKARAATATLARSRQKKLDKMDIIEKRHERPKPSFGFREARTPGREVIVVKDLVIGYNRALTKPLNFMIERNKKIAIKGANGIGKSTLLKTLLGIIPPLSGNVETDRFVEPGYFEQEEAPSEKTALDTIWDEFPGMGIAEVRGALARCGLTNEHITSKMKVLSGGENAKVRLCRLMQRDFNLLVLDEPTNHLDKDAKEELQRAIKDFKGTVILVSHEPEFYEPIVGEIWNAEEWAI